MPFAPTYGFGVELRSASNSGRFPSTGKDTLVESPVYQSWVPTQGMTHPIYTTTVVSPSAGYKGPRIPFKILVSFDPDDHLPAYMGGDVRVELNIDGVACGLKVFKESKFRGKGFQHEFCGFRVGRTEERPFVFNQVPSFLQSDNIDPPVKGSQNIAASFTSRTVDMTKPDYAIQGADHSRYPIRPSFTPENVSHVEIVISVGKKFATLEKYFMAGATQTTAFYHPPDPRNPLDPKKWQPLGRSAKKNSAFPDPDEEYAAPVKAQGGRSTPYMAIKEEFGKDFLAEGTKVFGKNVESATWKPIGLHSQTKKTQQLKEVEFSTRIHVVRFWIFAVPSLDISPLSFPISLKINPGSLRDLEDGRKIAIVPGKDTAAELYEHKQAQPMAPPPRRLAAPVANMLGDKRRPSLMPTMMEENCRPSGSPDAMGDKPPPMVASPRKAFPPDKVERAFKLNNGERTFKPNNGEWIFRPNKEDSFKSNKEARPVKPVRARRTVGDDSDELSDVDENIAKNAFPTARKGARKTSTSVPPQTSRKSMETRSSESYSSMTSLKKDRRALSPTNTRVVSRVPGDQKSAIERDRFSGVQKSGDERDRSLGDQKSTIGRDRSFGVQKSAIEHDANRLIKKPRINDDEKENRMRF